MRRLDSGDLSRPFTEHLGELRAAILRSLGVFLGALGACFFFADSIYRVLFVRAIPVVERYSVDFVALNLLDRFWIPMKLAMAGALTLTLPVLIWNAYRFVLPALDKREVAAVRSAFLVGPLLYLGGAGLWFYFALPQAIEFLATMGPGTLKNVLSLNEFVGFALSMGLVFGILFELPLLLLVLIHAGLLSHGVLAGRRREAVVVMAAVSGIATPSPDALSMLVLLVPLVLLFELTLLLGGRLERRRREQPSRTVTVGSDSWINSDESGSVPG